MRSRHTLIGSVLVGAVAALGVACVPPPEPIVAIEMKPGGHFFSMPWPSDTRRAPDGSLELAGLPGVELLPGEEPTAARALLPGIVEEMGASLDGFGVNSAAYFRSDVTLKPSSFPSPSASVGPSSTVMLIDLDHPGERVPVLVDFQRLPDRNRPERFLSVLPYPGHPLRESNRYAVALFDGLRLGGDRPPLPAPLIAQLDDPWSPETGFDEADWNLLRAQRDELRTVIDTTTNWSPNDLLAFTVYTTQDVDRDMRAVADTIGESVPPVVTVSEQGACTADSRAGGTQTSALRGTIELTRWQQGTYPYYGSGGEIVVGGDGRAVPQASFDAEFSARVPCGPPPASGWPLVAFITGTGGHWDLNSTTLPFDYQGYVIAEIAPVYGVGRGISLTPQMAELGLSSTLDAQRFTMYNFLNPNAVRTNTIQQAAEFLELLEAMEHLELDGPTLGTSGVVTTDPDRQVVTGQSQGSQALPMVAAMRPSLVGVIAGAGGGAIHHSISRTVFNRNFMGQLTGDAEALDELNPIVQLGQAMVDGGDGINYPSSVNYLQYHGRNDCVPEYGRYAAGATGLDLVYWFPPEGTYGDEALEPRVATLPVQGNVGGKTRVALERPGGHFVAYDQIQVNSGFLAELAAGQVPTVPAEGFVVGGYSTYTCDGDRWDVPPTLFGR
jgi:hypothetical protein